MIQLTNDPINIAGLVETSILPDCGATVLFLGTVRERTGSILTLSLTYQAYEKMALSQLREIADNAIRNWSLGDLSIIHRLGCCKPKDVVVAIIATARHRAEAFDACAGVMNEIKRIVPIWKEELDSHGKARWVHPGMS